MRSQPPTAGFRPTLLQSLALAAVSLPMSMLSLPLVVNVPEHFGNGLGLSLAVVGAVFMAVRILDIVIDPVLGLLMDATSTRLGRFRPWLLVGIPLVVIGVVMLFMPPRSAGAVHLMIGLVIAYVGWSVVSLAQLSLAAGLASDYGGRARIYAWLQSAFLIGICLVMLLPLLMGRQGNDATAALRAMGLMVILTIIPVTLLAAFIVPEPVRQATSARVRQAHWLKAYLALLVRPAVFRLVALDILYGLGFGVSSVVLIFYVTTILGLERNLVGLLLIAQMAAGALTMPLVGRLAARWGKHVVLALCGLGTALTVPLLAFAKPGDVVFPLVVMAVWGVFYGGVTFLPRSMMADAGDEVLLETKQDRTGVLYALLISSWKLGGALSVGLSFILLDIIGYKAALGPANTPEALEGLRWLFIGSPAILGLLGAAVAWSHPLTRTRSRTIRALLDEQDASTPTASPATA